MSRFFEAVTGAPVPFGTRHLCIFFDLCADLCTAQQAFYQRKVSHGTTLSIGRIGDTLHTQAIIFSGFLIDGGQGEKRVQPVLKM